jgi:hypothetical protein
VWSNYRTCLVAMFLVDKCVGNRVSDTYTGPVFVTPGYPYDKNAPYR